MAAPEPALEGFAITHGLAAPGEDQTWTPLAGGVSSDIWKLEAGGRTVCVKRALAKLRVAADWRAPVERNRYEWRWFQTARAILPEAVPEPIACDEDAGLLAMAYLEPADHPLWKRQLLDGQADLETARQVGDRLGRIHAATAGRPDIAERFATDEIFFALRLDAYLLATARVRPEVASAIEAIVARTAATKLALVHGDVSPKNILIGPKGPVFLDAETAWWGDPAFDLAFCLNHLLLKRLVAPQAASALADSFDALADAYLAHVDWEAREVIEGRVAKLLPGLLLARVDGKSPVEYLREGPDRDAVRAHAIPLLRSPPSRLSEVASGWF